LHQESEDAHAIFGGNRAAFPHARHGAESSPGTGDDADAFLALGETSKKRRWFAATPRQRSTLLML
jgi:hypothetical protein